MVDQHPDPKENAMPSPQSTPLEPFIHIREEVPRYWMVDSLWTVLASAEATGGALTVLDQLMPHRSGPPTHIHDRLHEYFSLLDGEIHFQLGQEVTTARTVAMLSIPAGTVHGFAVASKTARVLNLYTPGGFTEQISFLGSPASELRLPNPDEQPPATPEQYNAYLTRSAELNTQTLATPRRRNRSSHRQA